MDGETERPIISISSGQDLLIQALLNMESKSAQPPAAVPASKPLDDTQEDEDIYKSSSDSESEEESSGSDYSQEFAEESVGSTSKQTSNTFTPRPPLQIDLLHFHHMTDDRIVYDCNIHRVLFWEWYNGLTGHLGFVDSVLWARQGHGNYSSYWLGNLNRFAQSNPKGSSVPRSVMNRFLGLEDFDSPSCTFTDCIPGFDSAYFTQSRPVKVLNTMRYKFQVYKNSQDGLIRFLLTRVTSNGSGSFDHGWTESPQPTSKTGKVIKKSIHSDPIMPRIAPVPARASRFVEPATLPVHEDNIPLWKRIKDLEERKENIAKELQTVQSELDQRRKKLPPPPKTKSSGSMVNAEKARGDALYVELNRLKATFVSKGRVREAERIGKEIERAETVKIDILKS